MLGYATWYTMLPVFSLVLDSDVKDEIALQYPELYHELQKGRALNMRTFLLWCLQSVYQVWPVVDYGGMTTGVRAEPLC